MLELSYITLFCFLFQAVNCKGQHSISYTLSRNQTVVVEYSHDKDTDMFQVKACRWCGNTTEGFCSRPGLNPALHVWSVHVLKMKIMNLLSFNLRPELDRLYFIYCGNWQSQALYKHVTFPLQVNLMINTRLVCVCVCAVCLHQLFPHCHQS